jgi:hypothetical protein
MTRHYFAGANTPRGFFSYYGDIMPFDGTDKKIYIKGGSGTGKSTLMRKTAGLFVKRGNFVEYFHCSNDAESLDGISITDLGIAVVDGTSPHPADPMLPGAVDEMFDASAFLDKAFIRESKAALTELLNEKKALYGRAYGYLGAAYEVYRLNERIYESALGNAALNAKSLELLSIFAGASPPRHKAQNRRLFVAAITPEGVRSLAVTALKAERTYVLHGTGAMGIFEILDTVQRTANLTGHDTVSFKSPLSPAQTGHLYVPALDTAFVSSNRYHEYACDNAENIYVEELLNPAVLEKHTGELDYNSGIFDELLQKAIGTMAKAKEAHSQIEAVYSEAMDFKRMHRAYDKVLEWLMQ